MEDDNRFSYFFLGVGLGVAAGILFAPKSGSETRDLLRSKAGEGSEYLKKAAGDGTEYLKKASGDIKNTAGDLVDKGKDALGRQKDTLNAAVEAGKQAYRDAVTGAERNVGNEGY